MGWLSVAYFGRHTSVNINLISWFTSLYHISSFCCIYRYCCMLLLDMQLSKKCSHEWYMQSYSCLFIRQHPTNINQQKFKPSDAYTVRFVISCISKAVPLSYFPVYKHERGLSREIWIIWQQQQLRGSWELRRPVKFWGRNQPENNCMWPWPLTYDDINQ